MCKYLLQMCHPSAVHSSLSAQQRDSFRQSICISHVLILLNSMLQVCVTISMWQSKGTRDVITDAGHHAQGGHACKQALKQPLAFGKCNLQVSQCICLNAFRN